MASNISEASLHFVGNDVGQDGGRGGTNLVAQWKMNDNLATTNVIDSAGYLDGTAQQNTEDLNTTGKVNDALTFNGTSDYIQIPASVRLDIGARDYTIMAWMYPTGATDDNFAIFDTEVGTVNRYSLFIGSNNKPLAHMGATAFAGTNATFGRNEWIHFAASFDRSGNVDFYINGALDSSVDISAKKAANLGTGDGFIGVRSNTTDHWFAGNLDDVRIYNYALNITEIGDIYNSDSGDESALTTAAIIPGDYNAGGGCTAATFSGDLSDYMGADGAVLYNNAGCTIDDDGGYVRITSAGNFAADLDGVLVNCNFSGGYDDGVYPIRSSTANSITIELTYDDFDLVENGTFDSTDNWTTAGNWSISGGKLVGAAVVNNFAENDPTFASKAYTTSFTVSDFSAGQVRVKLGDTVGTWRSANGTYVEEITDDSTFKIQGLAFTGKVDDCSCIETALLTITVEVWVGGAFPSLASALADDSTDAADYSRIIACNLDTVIAASLETGIGGTKGSNTYLKLVAFHTKLYKPSEDTADIRIISDMDADSYSGDYAAQFSTSYYGGFLDAARKDESKTQNNANATWVEIDADGGAFDVVTIGGNNIEMRNFKIFNTNKGSGNNGLYTTGARFGLVLNNCWFDAVYDAFNPTAANFDESRVYDCYFGSDVGRGYHLLSGISKALIDQCFFNGTGLTIACGAFNDLFFRKCVFYKGAAGLNPDVSRSYIYNCIFFDQTSECFKVNAIGDAFIITNCILSPVAVADVGVRIDSLGDITGSNNIVYSFTADGALTNPFYNNGASANFWLPNIIESNPDFVDATNFDFRVNTGSPAINAGIGLDGDRGDSSIGLDALDRAGGGGGLIIHPGMTGGINA